MGGSCHYHAVVLNLKKKDGYGFYHAAVAVSKTKKEDGYGFYHAALSKMKKEDCYLVPLKRCGCG